MRKICTLIDINWYTGSFALLGIEPLPKHSLATIAEFLVIVYLLITQRQIGMTVLFEEHGGRNVVSK